MPKLDDASWHSGADNFPEDLPEESAATHIGFFVTWAIKNGLWGSMPGTDWSDAVQQVRNEVISGRKFLLQECGGKFLSEMLEAKGRIFAQEYYPRAYFKDYQKTLAAGLQSEYLVADTWENFRKIAGVIDRRHTNWKEKPWWKFWSSV